MHHTHGSIEVICGSMFSGKTDELIRRLVRSTIAKQKVQVFKPAIDIRYAVEKVTSHAGANFDAIPVQKAEEILSKIDNDTTVVGIDEAQFMDDECCRGCPAIWPKMESGCWWRVLILIFAVSRSDQCPS